MSFNLVKDFLVMSLKHKTEKVNWEELGTNASLLPLIYLVVMAPGFLTLLGLTCFLTTGVAYFYFGLNFPINFFLVLGGSFIGLGFLLILLYRIIIKYQFRMKKCRRVEQDQASMPAKSHLDQAMQPFLKQLLAEHRLFLEKPSE
jgi:Ca2+/H+ antiporter